MKYNLSDNVEKQSAISKFKHLLDEGKRVELTEIKSQASSNLAIKDIEITQLKTEVEMLAIRVDELEQNEFVENISLALMEPNLSDANDFKDYVETLLNELNKKP